MQPRARGMSGFSPRGAFAHFGASLEETTGMWKALLQQETSGATTLYPPRCGRHLFHWHFSVSCPVSGNRWSYTHNRPLGRGNCHPFLRWQVALGLLGPCPFQKHSACGRMGREHRHLSLEAGHREVIWEFWWNLATFSPWLHVHWVTGRFWEPDWSPLWLTSNSQLLSLLIFLHSLRALFWILICLFVPQA